MNIKTFVVVASLVLPAYANAAFNDAASATGSVNAQGAGTTAVAQVDQMWDESHVVVEGYLVEQTGGERYTFRDDSGSIQVELEHEDFRGLNVSSDDKVRIYGEVDRGFNSASIEGSRIERVQ